MRGWSPRLARLSRRYGRYRRAMSETSILWFGRVERRYWTDEMQVRAEAAEGVTYINEDSRLFGPSEAPVLLHWLASPSNREDVLRRIHDAVGVDPAMFDPAWRPEPLPS
jgi:hypothetical protein